MTRGLSRSQLGVTEQMIEAFGDYIWRHSTNLQLRRGDPVRNLDWEAIEAQRPGTGFSDAEIASRIGLTRDQVTFIRVALEHRRFRRDAYYRLNDLGGGRRFRAERFTPHTERLGFAAEAIALRRSLRFDPALTARFLDSGQWNAETVSSWLAHWAEAAPDRPAIVVPPGVVPPGVAPGITLSYAEVHAKARRLAGALAALGLRKGDVIAIQLANTPEFLLAYFAATMFGAILATLHMPYRRGEMRTLLRHGRARAVICGPATESYDAPATMAELRDEIDGLDHIVVAGGAAPDGAHALAAMIADGPDWDGDGPVAADPAVLCFTSGTSAAPKAVVHTHHTLLANNRACAGLYNLGPDDVCLSGAPFTHAFGICIVNFTLISGATNLLMPLFTPAALADAIEDGRPTQLFVAPAHIAAGLEAGAFEGRNLASVRIVTISGSPCPPQLAADFERLLPNGAVGQMWGMTESFMGLVTPFDDPPDKRHHTLGRPTPAVDLRIVGDSDAIAAPGEEGEIQIRGCSVIAGYFGNDDADREAFAAGGWFRTGDLAAMDSDGYVRITGRVKDIVNRGGIKINPADIEALLDKHPKVARAAIVAMPDAVLGEKACLFVSLAGEEAPTLDEICAYLADNDVAKMKWPERLEIIAEMPLTPTRKIAKASLAERLRSG